MSDYAFTLDIEHLPEGPYLGTSPDLLGLIIQAGSAEEIIRLAPDIARDLIAVMTDTGQPLPDKLVAVKVPGRIPMMVAA